MEKTSLAIAVLFTASISCVLAGTDSKEMAAPLISPSDAGFYVAIEGGANIGQDYGNKQLTYDETGGMNSPFHSNQVGDHTGGMGGLKVGYNFESYDIAGDFRLQPAAELETYYLGTKLKFNNGTNTDNFWGPGESTYTANLNSVTFMLNGIVRFKTGTIFTPYVGLGVGGEYLQTSHVLINHTGPGAPVSASPLSDNDVVCAAQGIAGFEIEVAEGWDIFTEYKYVAAMDPSFSYYNIAPAFATEGLNVKFNPNFIGQSIIAAGLKYNF